MRHNLIEGGFYSEAAALLKQAMESVAGAQECLEEIRRDGKNPNVKKLWFGFATIFGDINDAAHLGNIDSVFAYLSDPENTSANITPLDTPEIARNYLGLHVGLSVQALHILCFICQDCGVMDDSQIAPFVEQVHANAKKLFKIGFIVRD